MKTLFDSQQFSWSDMSVQVGSRVMIGITGLRYGEKQDHGYIYGAGTKPLSIQKGNINYEGELKLLQSELELLIRQSPSGRIQDIPDMIITATYNQGLVLITDILTGVVFPEMEKSFNQNDPKMEVTLPIMFLNLQLNA